MAFNYYKISFLVLLVSFLSGSCQKEEGARKPISRASGSFMKQSVERNKKLVATEEDQIKAIIKKNPKIDYIASKKGYWYYYDIQNTTDTLTPKKGDVAFFTYEIKNLKGEIIYSELELRPQTYYVDKEEIMMGLRDGIKLMHKKEKINFLFPSHIAYGYHGDNKKIGVNQPIICTVTLTNFVSENTYKKYTGQPKTQATTTAPVATEAPVNDTLN
ncbi:gliding motility-associated peptidyl-prolyl isomerase GldI [Flavobacterium agrisoli]|uniref:Peptidyl-prolyl cis-trans isomerase n=1 Tax=Flavobacterium agrisoli TaxID=2793066 RepID=A0A934UIT3_9FLAO|nr:gliding motility-associated peptidyl-prolyl isomerase GldI [Flavobacterium agrisoli]MBK0369167.1 gliding motility-associated peptidyl-prolyl isomerase GldI [Flavobacterium agrisoli]